MFSLLSLFPGGGLPRIPCGLVEPCGFMAKVTKVDEKASDEEVALISLHVILSLIDKGTTVRLSTTGE